MEGDRRGQRDATLLALNMEGRAESQGMGVPAKRWERTRFFPPEPPQRNALTHDGLQRWGPAKPKTFTIWHLLV